jgi:hypothetical protein
LQDAVRASAIQRGISLDLLPVENDRAE